MRIKILSFGDLRFWYFLKESKMGSLGAILKHPVDIYPLLKLKMAAKHAEKQIPREPHWAFCYSMLPRVSRSFALVIQQLDTELRNAVSIISIAFSCVICLVLISLSLYLRFGLWLFVDYGFFHLCRYAYFIWFFEPLTLLVCSC